MSGSASDSASTDEVSDPLMPDVRHPDTFATRTPESASKSYERMASRSKPGETQTTSRRMSDTPTTTRDSFQEDEEQSKSMLEKAHEMVSKALGGGSRGSS